MGQCKFSIDDNYSSLIFERLFNRNINFSHVLGYIILDSRSVTIHQRESQSMSVFETEEIYDISTLRWQRLSSLFVGIYNIVVPFEKADVGMS